jgi:hypothetical protein
VRALAIGRCVPSPYWAGVNPDHLADVRFLAECTWLDASSISIQIRGHTPWIGLMKMH